MLFKNSVDFLLTHAKIMLNKQRKMALVKYGYSISHFVTSVAIQAGRRQLTRKEKARSFTPSFCDIKPTDIVRY